MAKWYEIAREYRASTRMDIESGALDPYDDNAVDEYAWEYADGSQDVIYTHLAREAWITGADEWEDEASDLGPFDSPQAWITATVFCAIRGTILEEVEAWRQEYPESDDEEGNE